MKIIFDYNRTIFDPDIDALYPGVLDLLSTLSQKNKLFLISRNEPARKDRMKELGIEKYFQKVAFVAEKSPREFQEMAGDGKNVLVVGDSITDEIKIGNRLGFITVRLKKGKFAMETPMQQDEIAIHDIFDILDLEKVISTYEK